MNHDFEDVKAREACGVIGILMLDGTDCVGDIYNALFSLQHRGQESCGIAAFDADGNLKCKKGMGLLTDVFHDGYAELSGSTAMGHVSYSTKKESVPENTQPLTTRTAIGQVALAHNGTLVNSGSLEKQLLKEGYVLHTTADTELIDLVFAQALHKSNGKEEEAMQQAMQRLRGAYSIVVALKDKLIAARDPYGYRPLCLGQMENGYAFASETCALEAVGATFVRDIRPGEVVTVDKDGVHSLDDLCGQKPQHCIFEYIYFARSDSVIDGVSVYESRVNAGRELYREFPVDADIVIGVPDSGTNAAIGYALESGIPYQPGFVKNSYVGRTFISSTQSKREKGVMIKLNVIKKSIEGKRIVMVDDSIVRGTTCKRIVRMLRAAGAKEVHVRISSPPFLYPCYYGTDVGITELVATNRTTDAVCDYIGADSLEFLKLESLPHIVNHQLSYCDACFTGNYAVKPE